MPVECETLLGANISNNFTWNQHLRDDKKSLFNKLRQKLGILRKICSICDFRTRKMIAEGLFMSNLIYAIQVYGACSKYLVSMLQTQQNIVARYVTKLPFLTPTNSLLSQCGWLSVKQLIKYHSLVLLFRTFKEKKPNDTYT